MLKIFSNIINYRDLIYILSWKEIIVRYKQSYLGLLWTILKPLGLMLIFTMVSGFVGIDTGKIPYPVLTFVALVPWVFLQESLSAGANSIVSNSSLIKKIYFPREVLPIVAVMTRFVELVVNMFIASLLMWYYSIEISINALWVPLIVLYVFILSTCLSFVFSAVNVYYRDITHIIPIFLSLLMYGSPIMYPLSLVYEALIVKQKAGRLSEILYDIYLCNPVVGIIDGFQNVLLKQSSPQFEVMLPGIIFTAIISPFCYILFKRAEKYFADIV